MSDIVLILADIYPTSPDSNFSDWLNPVADKYPHSTTVNSEPVAINLILSPDFKTPLTILT